MNLYWIFILKFSKVYELLLELIQFFLFIYMRMSIWIGLNVYWDRVLEYNPNPRYVHAFRLWHPRDTTYNPWYLCTYKQHFQLRNARNSQNTRVYYDYIVQYISQFNCIISYIVNSIVNYIGRRMADKRAYLPYKMVVRKGYNPMKPITIQFTIQLTMQLIMRLIWRYDRGILAFAGAMQLEFVFCSTKVSWAMGRVLKVSWSTDLVAQWTWRLVQINSLIYIGKGLVKGIFIIEKVIYKSFYFKKLEHIKESIFRNKLS